MILFKALHRSLLGLALLAMLPHPIAAAAAPPVAVTQTFLPAERRQKLDQYLELLEKNHKLMASIAISQHGQMVYQKQIGFADQAAAIKNGPQTRFRIGSISKVFTSVLIFQLIESGKLSLDTLLSDFFPQIPNAGKITVSMLLNHRSGIENFTAQDDYLSYMTQPQSRAAMLERMSKSKPVFVPDSRAEYSNSNYVLLSMMIEKLTAKPYGEILNQRIIVPLKLARTGFGGPVSSKNGDAGSYSFAGQGWQRTPDTDVSIPLGAGAVISTPAELNVFLRALFQGQLISKASLARMTELREGYGRGIFATPFGAMNGFGHNGAIDGFQSATTYFPEQDLSLSLLANGVNTEFNEMLIGILSLYEGKPFVMPDFNAKPITLTPAQLQAYAGLFGSKDIPLKLEFKVINGVLQAQATGQNAFTLDAYPANEFRQSQIGLRIVFDKPGTDGKITGFMLYQSGQSFRFTREK